MKPAVRFSLAVFAPLYVALVLPALFLLPANVLMTFISALDTTLPMAESAAYGAWGVGPLVAACALLLTGTRLHTLHLQGGLRRLVWPIIWAVFSIALFVSVWFGLILLTSVGASDTSTGEFLRWTARTAALLTLALQPGVGLWLLVACRILRSDAPPPF